MTAPIVDMLRSYAPILVRGTWVTIQLWAVSYALSLLVGITAGILRCRRLRSPLLSWPLDLFVKVLQGIPLYTQLLIGYFVVPRLIGYNFSEFTTGIVVLGLCSAAYTAEIIRGTANALADEQWETAQVLGYSRYAQVRFIVLPQVLRYAIPALANECNLVLKSTSILASIGIVELTKIGLNIVASSMDPLGIFLAIACAYLALTTLSSLVWNFLERKLAW